MIPHHLHTILKNVLKNSLNFLYPNRCLLCMHTLSIDCSMICQKCQMQLPWQTHYCFQCANPLNPMTLNCHSSSPSESTRLCGQCIQKNPSFDMSFAAWEYTPPISHFITQLKFNHKLQYAKLLGHLLVEYILKHRPTYLPWPEYILPVPLHNKRLSQRGFNQALEIARPIAHQLKIPIHLHLCDRQKDTLSQIKLDASERVKNLNQAFKVKETVFPKHLAIIDDVMTTGTTVNFLSQTLKHHGVEKIEIWSCARPSIPV